MVSNLGWWKEVIVFDRHLVKEKSMCTLQYQGFHFDIFSRFTGADIGFGL